MKMTKEEKKEQETHFVELPLDIMPDEITLETNIKLEDGENLVLIIEGGPVGWNQLMTLLSTDKLNSEYLNRKDDPKQL